MPVVNDISKHKHSDSIAYAILNPLPAVYLLLVGIVCETLWTRKKVCDPLSELQASCLSLYAILSRKSDI